MLAELHGSRQEELCWDARRDMSDARSECHDDDPRLVEAVQAGARRYLSIVISGQEAARVIERLLRIDDDATVEVSGRELLTGMWIVSRIGWHHIGPSDAPLAAMSR